MWVVQAKLLVGSPHKGCSFQMSCMHACMTFDACMNACMHAFIYQDAIRIHMALGHLMLYSVTSGKISITLPYPQMSTRT